MGGEAVSLRQPLRTNLAVRSDLGSVRGRRLIKKNPGSLSRVTGNGLSLGWRADKSEARKPKFETRTKIILFKTESN